MRRRDFLVQTGHATLALAALPSQRALPHRIKSLPLPSPSASPLADLVAHLKERIPQWLHDAKVPGLGIAIVRDAKIAWRSGFGAKDTASKEPVTDDTMFEAASMSKPVFAYVVMKLCEGGTLDLDVPLTRYVPERFLEGDSRLELITARHLLSHTGGFQNWRSDREPLAIHFTPGERYLYSGEGYNYLQTVVTHLLGIPFEHYMSARLFRPFGMSSSGYVWNDRVARRMARPHDQSGLAIDNQKSTSAGVARYGSAGALLTTPTDYAKFLIEVIAPKGSDRFRLTQESVREMLRPHVTVPGGRYPASWALGWQVFQNNQRDFIYHGGDNKGFHCATVGSVAGRSGFVALTNGENGTTVLRNLITDDRTQEFLAA